MKSAFVLLVTGLSGNDSVLKRVVEDKPYICYRLPYTSPYQEFYGIKQFQLEAKYKPFEDSTDSLKYAAIDLSEWEGHEEEEYLDIFMKFVHDYTGYFDFKYIFLTGCTEKEHIKSLSRRLHRYLGEGEVLMDKTFLDEKVMSSYISNRYNVEKTAALRLASCFLSDGIGGYAELELIMRDTKERVKNNKQIDMEDVQMLVNTKSSKLYALYKDSKYLIDDANISK